MKQLSSIKAICVIMILLFSAGAASAALITYNSPTADITATRQNWLAGAGISSAQYLVDFESIAVGTNVSGITSLFPGGLVITDTGSAHSATIITGAGSIGGSNPVDSRALFHRQGPYLLLDFGSVGVDYAAFRDIDQQATGVTVFFASGSSYSFTLDDTAGVGNSAEFVGFWRNDMPRITLIQLNAGGSSGWGVDNIEYGRSAVPIPAPFFLLGAGLAGLIGLRRRKYIIS